MNYLYGTNTKYITENKRRKAKRFIKCSRYVNVVCTETFNKVKLAFMIKI